ELVAIVITEAGEVGEHGPDGSTQALAQRVREAFRQTLWPSVIGSMSGQILSVASATPKGGMRTKVTALIGRLSDDGVPCRLGVSRPTRASLLRRAYAEAQTAHELGPAT